MLPSSYFETPVGRRSMTIQHRRDAAHHDRMMRELYFGADSPIRKMTQFQAEMNLLASHPRFGRWWLRKRKRQGDQTTEETGD